MSIEYEVIGWVSGVSLTASLGLTFLNKVTVRGSLINCLLGQLAMASVVLTIILSITAIFIAIDEGFTGDTIAHLFIIGVAIWILRMLVDDEGDWFNRQRTWLKKGFKRLGTWRPRLPALAPSPT